MEIIKHNLIKVTGIVKIIYKDTKGNIVKFSEYKNTVVNTGLQLLCDLIGDNATEGVTYIALGDDTTTPALTDTVLGNETFRKQIAFRSRLGQTETLSSYLTTSEGNDNHRELGHFGNGATATAGSGILFNHTAINETKTDAVTWTIEQTFTFTNA